jgi:phosphoglycerate dehydrogenase-like enzyme
MAERFERIHVHLAALADYARHPEEPRLHDREFVILPDDESFLDALPEIEVLMGFRVPGGHWSRASRLRLIQIPGAGVDSVVGQPDLSPDVVICNASGTHEPEMSEFVIAMLLATTYRVPSIVDQQRARRWRPVIPGRPLTGGRLCILGLGTIGQAVARRAAGLGMDVVGARNSGRPVDGVTRVVRPEQRLEVLEGATALVILTPLTDETRGLVGAEELAALAPGAVVVDVSRGGVTDLDALVSALDSGRIAAAAVDVFPTEPLPEGDPLWKVPNLLVTPHTAGSSSDYRRRIAACFADNLLAYEGGGTPPGLVDRALGY